MTNNTITMIMTADESGAELVKFAHQTGSTLAKSLKRSQIRTIFSEARQIEAMWNDRPEDALRRLNMLKPKMAYQAARIREVAQLKDVLADAIDEVQKAPAEKRASMFERFMDLFEAILAYHRAEGGKD